MPADTCRYIMSGRSGETPLPVRWMAPEAIKRRTYSEASDVWSYAVMVCHVTSVFATMQWWDAAQCGSFILQKRLGFL
jgi:serine/threonine protein kinase